MKKILLGLVALSSVAMAAQDTTPTQTDSNGLKGTFSNRLGINYLTKGSEDWDDSSNDDTPNVFKASGEIDYKLLYNVTDRFRWGGELGLDISPFNNKFRKPIKGTDKNMGAVLLGITGEYDVYQGRSAAIYLNGSIGAAAGKTPLKYENGEKIGTIKADSYLKIGIGTRFNNGLGLEVGRRSMQYKVEVKGESSDSLYRGQTYVQLNYTF